MVEQHGVYDRNGRLDRAELQTISGGWGERDYALLPPAAAPYEEMRSAAAADGMNLQVIDAYRSWEVQATAYEAYLAGRKKEHVVAPGTSEHGNGLAVDFTDGAIIGRDDPEWRWLQDKRAGSVGTQSRTRRGTGSSARLALVDVRDDPGVRHSRRRVRWTGAHVPPRCS